MFKEILLGPTFKEILLGPTPEGQTVTFTKLSDESWGVRVKGGSRPMPGDRLMVVRKDERKVPVEVERVIWSAPAAAPEWICAIVEKTPERRGRTT